MECLTVPYEQRVTVQPLLASNFFLGNGAEAAMGIYCDSVRE